MFIILTYVWNKISVKLHKFIMCLRIFVTNKYESRLIHINNQFSCLFHILFKHWNICDMTGKKGQINQQFLKPKSKFHDKTLMNNIWTLKWLNIVQFVGMCVLQFFGYDGNRSMYFSLLIALYLWCHCMTVGKLGICIFVWKICIYVGGWLTLWVKVTLLHCYAARLSRNEIYVHFFVVHLTSILSSASQWNSIVSSRQFSVELCDGDFG